MRNKRVSKPSKLLKTKEGPIASMAEGMLKSIGRHYWVVLSGFSFHQICTPKAAKAQWRKLNAREWQKKATPIA